jgi:hypothetical protein
MAKKKEPQLSLGLDLPERIEKKLKGYYLPLSTIKFVKDEAKRLSTKKVPVSENVLLKAIIDFYYKHNPSKGKPDA